MDTNIVLLNQGYDQTFQAREQRLIDILSTYDELVVSFSGRLESCYAMDLCRASGTRIRALTLDNPLLSRRELARAHRYCQRYNIEQRVLKTDEMLFCDIEQPPKVAKDPVRFIDEAKAKQVDWDHLPLLIPASLEEMQAYLGRFHQPPPRTLWLFAREGMCHRDLRYGFHKRELERWGKASGGYLNRRFQNISQMDRSHVQMIDMAEQILADMGLDDAEVHFHSLNDDSVTLARVRLPSHQRARGFDRQLDIYRALKGMAFDYVTLDMALPNCHDIAG
ncbi:MAG: hypothetical protein WBF70_12125 [Aeromonas molluscorum]